MAIARTRIARRARGRIDGLHRRRRDVVPPRGFEPLISTLKGWRPRPLDDGGTGARTAPSLAEGPASARRLAKQEEDDRAGHAAGTDDRRETAADGEREGAPVPAVDARPARSPARSRPPAR